MKAGGACLTMVVVLEMRSGVFGFIRRKFVLLTLSICMHAGLFLLRAVGL